MSLKSPWDLPTLQLLLVYELYYVDKFNKWTAEGDLYTFGSGQHGALGHNDGEVSHVRPKLVEFFKKNGLKIVDVDIGEHHTVALTGKSSIDYD